MHFYISNLDEGNQIVKGINKKGDENIHKGYVVDSLILLLN